MQVLLTPTHLAIVMEYAAGGELFERICNAGRFSEDEVVNLYPVSFCSIYWRTFPSFEIYQSFLYHCPVNNHLFLVEPFYNRQDFSSSS